MQQQIVQPARQEIFNAEISGRPLAEPEVSYHYVELSKTRLHYMKSGDGPPMVMVPATISRIENWRSLAQFMAQKFTVYFFELPGHGESLPFREAFSTGLVAETVEAFIDRMKHKTISLMGFSFGGILAMETLRLLQERVQKVVLIAPALSKRALQYARVHLWTLRNVVKVLKKQSVRAGLLRLIRNPRWSPVMAALLARFSNIDKTISMEKVFKNITDSTADVLSYQLDELLNFELPDLSIPFRQPCYCAMSINDPMLDFGTTMGVLQKQFSQVHVERFTHRYHQPPRPLSFLEIVQQYNPLLETITGN
ncbi:MAG TPA: alpha/beta fold hydrolase [Anaerolineales bacterium]|nr:alpha/beta fold hydrolase [Anaerolineales bacterium]